MTYFIAGLLLGVGLTTAFFTRAHREEMREMRKRTDLLWLKTVEVEMQEEGLL